MSDPSPKPLSWWEQNLLGVSVRQLPSLFPGLALAIAVMALAQPVADWLGARILAFQGLDPEGRASPVSGIVVAILGGMAIANTIGVHDRFKPGLTFALKKVLRLGIDGAGMVTEIRTV